jgi:hypothetical protein
MAARISGMVASTILNGVGDAATAEVGRFVWAATVRATAAAAERPITAERIMGCSQGVRRTAAMLLASRIRRNGNASAP